MTTKSKYEPPGTAKKVRLASGEVVPADALPEWVSQPGACTVRRWSLEQLRRLALLPPAQRALKIAARKPEHGTGAGRGLAPRGPSKLKGRRWHHCPATGAVAMFSDPPPGWLPGKPKR